MLSDLADTLWRIVAEIGLIFYESSVFVLLGFTLAGILHEFVPISAVAKRLGTSNIRSIIWATILGAPLPLCSCGVLPTAAALRRKGASKPAVASFIVSVPETGVDSIAVSYGLMGPIMAVVRPIVAIFTAFLAGVACLFVTRDESDDLDEATLRELEAHDHDHDHHHDHDHSHDHAGSESDSLPEGPGSRKRQWLSRLQRMLGYGFREMLDEVAFWIVMGLAVTGVMMALLPDDFFSSSLGLDGGLLPLLLMAVIGVPLYTCASMSTPVAAGFIATGLSPGAALVFLLAGPATSIASLSVVGKLLGRRTLVAYLASILTVAIAAGLLLDLYAADAIREATVSTFESPDGPIEQAFKVLCTLIFLGLFIDSISRRSYVGPIADIKKQGSLLYAGAKHVRRLGYIVAPLILLIIAAPLITTRVGPGQQGMVIRFGEVVQRDLTPGLYVHFPWPIDTMRVVSTSSVRDTRIAGTTREYLTSDENVIALTSIIQYRINDSYAYEFSGEQNVGLIRDLASRILVREILARPIDEIYTVERIAVEQAYRQRLTEEVATLNQGFEIVAARLEHVHAPDGVHDSFRDVSSALEDRQRATYEADGEAIAIVTDANARYSEAVMVAEGEATARVKVAEGRAVSFRPQADVFRAHPDVGRTRLTLETIERGLSGPRKYLNTVPGSRGVDLWIDPEQDDVIKFNYRE